VGLDYWKDVDLQIWESWDEFANSVDANRMWLLTTKSSRPHWDVTFEDGDYLVFGCETKGLPESLLGAHSEHTLTIPMIKNSTRSLNLATSVGIVLYEAARQVGLE
jgi:tRNA (cytidine/uridine-2'-O-)-methyltransferase